MRAVTAYNGGMTPATTASSLARTPFYQYHVDHSAKMVDFAGWEMPIRYGSVLDEHRQVRRSGGLFDVSHMGRLRFSGRDVIRFLDRVCTRQIHGMSAGQCRYSLICNEQGGCRDDVLVYCRGDNDYLMVCNAANRIKLLEHFSVAKGDLVFKVDDQTTKTAMVAIQGPKVIDLLSRFSSEVPSLKRFRFVEKNLLIARIMISRTGYTGEDGVEVIMPNAFAGKAIEMMLKSVGGVDGEDAVIKPIGLAARDTLRMEAAMPLYGHELTEELDPISAGLRFAVKLNKGEDDASVSRFIGQDALQKIADDGPKRTLTGLVLDGRRSARQDMTVLCGNEEVGFVTSGCLSPTLDQSIAMAYLDTEHAAPDTTVQIDLGRQRVDARVVGLPFYKAG